MLYVNSITVQTIGIRVVFVSSSVNHWSFECDSVYCVLTWLAKVSPHVGVVWVVHSRDQEPETRIPMHPRTRPPLESSCIRSGCDVIYLSLSLTRLTTMAWWWDGQRYVYQATDSDLSR